MNLSGYTPRRPEKPLPPAPGDLRILQEFLNTVTPGADELATPLELADWLVSRELLAVDAELTAGDLERAVAFRSNLRALVAGGTADPKLIAALDRTAAKALVRARFGADGTVRFEPAAPGLERALPAVQPELETDRSFLEDDEEPHA